ncbi:hypothetical protein Tco_0637110 [Tanacetum coccineum]
MKLLMAKCLNSTEYMKALRNAFSRAIEKGMQESLVAGIEHGQAGRCLTDLEAYIPSAEADFNSAIRDLRDLDFPLLQKLSNKKVANTWDAMDLLRLDNAMAEALGMTDFQVIFRIFASVVCFHMTWHSRFWEVEVTDSRRERISLGTYPRMRGCTPFSASKSLEHGALSSFLALVFMPWRS